MKTKEKAVLVIGPQGCGKTTHAQELANYYGKSKIIDDWEPATPIPSDAIALTKDCTLTIVDFKSALKAANLLKEIDKEPRFCINCFHFVPAIGIFGTPCCKAPEAQKIDLVTGPKNLPCVFLRKKAKACGPRGKLFRKKKSKPEREPYSPRGEAPDSKIRDISEQIEITTSGLASSPNRS